MSEKVRVVFNEDAVAVLENLQEASGAQSLSEVIRHALGFYEWARLKRKEGYVVGTINKRETFVKEVVLPFPSPDDKR